jgi:hypothetical protein
MTVVGPKNRCRNPDATRTRVAHFGMRFREQADIVRRWTMRAPEMQNRWTARARRGAEDAREKVVNDRTAAFSDKKQPTADRLERLTDRNSRIADGKAAFTDRRQSSASDRRPFPVQAESSPRNLNQKPTTANVAKGACHTATRFA